MPPASIPRDPGDFSVSFICALQLEAECVVGMLDQTWDSKKYSQSPSDDNAYTLGAIGEHNVVIIHLSGIGSVRAATAIANLKSSFSNIKLMLVVGVCGGIPRGVKNDIFLGDVVISEALLSYELGRFYPQGFERKTDLHENLGPPSEKILAILRRLQTEPHKAVLRENTCLFLKSLQLKLSKATFPGTDSDVLYDPSYAHRHRPPQECQVCRRGNEVCQDAVRAECEALHCDVGMRVTRSRSAPLQIHFGVVASGNVVMKSGQDRDMLAKQGIIAIEMEGAAAWRHGQTLVIKGVCDYADSHKNKRWQQYAAATGAACAKSFLLEWTSDKPKVNLDRLNTYFSVPRQQPKNFFGREDELAKIANYFGDETTRPRILVLYAMGGQGKSQIALEYCHQARQTHIGIFWINASSTSAITQSLVDVARQLNCSVTERLADDDAKVRYAIKTLEQWKYRWLMVFDNCDNPAVFPELEERFLPQVGTGNVLFTSRHRALEELSDLIEIPPMPLEAGVKLLLHRYRGINPTDHLSEGAKITNRLGNLALAIDQASAYMQHTHLPIDKLSTFLPKYLTQRESVLRYITPYFWRYMRIDNSSERETAIGAFTTWEMSFQQLLSNELRPDDVAHFLTMSAFFGQTPVDESFFLFHWAMSKPPPAWMGIFTARSSDATEQGTLEVTQNVPKANDDEASDRLLTSQQIASSTSEPGWNYNSFWNLLEQAFQISLLQSIQPAGGKLKGASLGLHPLIRDWLQLRQPLEGRQSYTREVIDALTTYIRTYATKSRNFQTNSTILLHMDAVLTSDNEFFNEESQLGRNVSTCDDAECFGSFYLDTGKHNDAERLHRMVMNVRMRALGAEHSKTLTGMNNLAETLRAQGKYSDTERIHRAVFEARQKVLGLEDPRTLYSMNNLACVLSQRGKYIEAEQMHRSLIAMNQQVLGLEHRSTLASMNNLASALKGQSRYSEAEQMHRQILEIEERISGKDHLLIATVMNNLALVLRYQDKNGEAEEIQHMVVDIMDRKLGKEHPSTLTSMNNLAIIINRLGKYNKSEQIYRTVLEASERVLGREHPSTLTSMGNLAVALSRQGKHGEAEQIQRTVMSVRERVLGPQHPSTLLTMSNLATVLHDQERYDEGEVIQLPAFESALMTLGRDHELTSECLETLQSIWKGQGHDECEIERMLQDTFHRIKAPMQ